MSKDSREAAESALARLCEWRGLNCYKCRQLFSRAADDGKNPVQDVRWTSALHRPKRSADRKLVCRGVLPSSDIGHLARIKDLALLAAVNCANPKCTAE